MTPWWIGGRQQDPERVAPSNIAATGTDEELIFQHIKGGPQACVPAGCIAPDALGGR